MEVNLRIHISHFKQAMSNNEAIASFENRRKDGVTVLPDIFRGIFDTDFLFFPTYNFMGGKSIIISLHLRERERESESFDLYEEHYSFQIIKDTQIIFFDMLC